jgi:hypothetical protein
MKLFSDKKGLGVGQAFVYIVAAITFTIIMIFGYKAITEFIGKGEMVQFVEFKTDLESSIQKMYSQFGSERKESFFLPSTYERICFIDLDTPYPGDNQCSFSSYGCDVWKEAWAREGEGIMGYKAAEENVFLDPSPEGTTQIKVYKIKISGGQQEGVLCEKVRGGELTLRFKGLGDGTQISPVTLR